MPKCVNDKGLLMTGGGGKKYKKPATGSGVPPRGVFGGQAKKIKLKKKASPSKRSLVVCVGAHLYAYVYKLHTYTYI